MRIETKTYEVYQFHELTKEAQVKAHRHWVEHFDYTWSEENRNTLQAFERVFKIKVEKWSYDRREDIVHPRYGIDNLGIVDGTGQIEENNVRHLLASAKAFCGGDGVLGAAADDGIVFLAQLSEQVIRLHLVIVILHDGVHVAFAHVMDTILGEVAVDDGDVISLYVMQVARHEHRERGLACSAFLGGESNIQWFVFLFVHCLLGFMDDTYIDTFVCRFVGFFHLMF